MLQAFVFERVGIVVGDLYFLDPDPHPGQEGAEHGVRLELRIFDRGDLKGTIYSATPIEVGRPIWRMDLLEAVDGKPGSFNRTHHHPQFNGWDPTGRQFLRELSSDPLGWLAAQLADLPAILERAGVPPEVADPSDAASLRDIAPAIVGVTSMMLDKVSGRRARPAARRRRRRQHQERLALILPRTEGGEDGRDHHEGRPTRRTRRAGPP